MSSYPWASNFLAYAFPCCDCGGCFLTLPGLLIDATDTPYADQTTAQTALTDQTVGCIAEYAIYGGGPGETRNAITASQNGTTTVVTLTDDISGFVTSSNMLIGFRLSAAGNVSIGYDLALTGATSGAVTADLYQDDQATLEDTATASTGSGGGTGTLTVTVPDNGTYYLLFSYGGDGTDLTIEWVITPPATDLRLCDVRAAWDDSGTTKYEACTP